MEERSETATLIELPNKPGSTRRKAPVVIGPEPVFGLLRRPGGGAWGGRVGQSFDFAAKPANTNPTQL